MSVAALERAISATALRRRRENAGQVIVPARGSVLASPVIADWDPEPDYFFHWVRDSAIAMRSVADLMADAPNDVERRRWRGHFEDFVCFSLGLIRFGGDLVAARRGLRYAARRGFDGQFLRPEADIEALSADALLAEPRFNPDGTVDIFRWSRPQHDGPALRALACLRYLAAGGDRSEPIEQLLDLDLNFTARHAGTPCIGPWEEPDQSGWHYYVELVQLGALRQGRSFAGASPDSWIAAEQRLSAALELYWSEPHQVLTAMRPASSLPADDLLDTATLLAVWDAGLPDGPHSVCDIRVQKTQAAIERLFARELPINRDRADAPSLGRSRRDRYFGGGAWYPTTLAAAGLCYRLAQRPEQDRRALIGRGDAFMATLRDLTPGDGALSEQIDRATGLQRSARHLTWSYAAFISAARERAMAVRSRPSRS